MQDRSKLSMNPSDLSFPTFINKEEPSSVEPSLDELLKLDRKEKEKQSPKTVNEPSSQFGGFVDNLNKRRLARIR